jgi:hypothetical protein
MTDSHPDPLTEGLISTGQRLVQIISLVVIIQQKHARRQARLRDAQAAKDKQAVRALNEERHAVFEQARIRWAPAHSREWLRDADLLQVADAWSAALPYIAEHPAAASAVRKCEERLRELHPQAMGQYDRFRSDGMSPVDGMLKAVPYFANDPRTRTSEPVNREALHEGTGLSWQSTEHGPARADWEKSRQEQRARQIITDLQQKLRDGQQSHLASDELRTVLTVTTNLPDDVIAKAVRDGTPEKPNGARTQDQVADEDFPIAVDEAMAITAQQSHASPATGRSPGKVVDRVRRPSRWSLRRIHALALDPRLVLVRADRHPGLRLGPPHTDRAVSGSPRSGFHHHDQCAGSCDRLRLADRPDHGPRLASARAGRTAHPLPVPAWWGPGKTVVAVGAA